MDIADDEDMEVLIGGWSAFEVELKDHLKETNSSGSRFRSSIDSIARFRTG